MPSPDYSIRRAAFRKLHESGCFVIPNPWDAGSARYLQRLGFKALATTSAGFAFSLGLADAAVPRDAMLRNIADIAAAVDLPVNADFESGYARDPEGVAANVQLCVDTGVAGLSIEDATGEAADPLFELTLAVDRIRAARRHRRLRQRSAAHRASRVLSGEPRRSASRVAAPHAYAEAGADVLYAPGLAERGDIKTFVAELNPKPVNLLMSRNTGLTVADVADLGVRRISIGSSLSRAAWTAFMHAAETIAPEGRFAGFDGLVPYAEINGFFKR